MTKHEAFELLEKNDQAWLRQMAETFGKPAAIAIRFRDGSRYDGGRFMAAQDFPDFTAPKPLYQRTHGRSARRIR